MAVPVESSRPATADQVVIGPMRRRHLRAVLRIEHEVSPRPWSLGLFLGEISRYHGRVYVVARIGGKVVGYAGLLMSDTDGHVTTVAVDPAWQGRRVGVRLVLVLTRWALAAGAQQLTLEVRVGNAPAIELYRQFGFAPVGVRENYYADVGEDALIMWAHGVATPAYAARLREIEERLPNLTLLEGMDT